MLGSLLPRFHKYLMEQLFHSDRCQDARHLSSWSEIIDATLSLQFVCDEYLGTRSGGVWHAYARPVRVYKTDLPFPHLVRRSRSRRELHILHQTGGQCRLRQCGNETVYRAGDIALVDAQADFEGDMSGQGGGIWLTIPLDGTTNTLAGLLDGVGMRIDGKSPAGSVASSFIATFAEHATSLGDRRARNWTKMLVELLNSAILEQAGKERQRNQSSAHLRRQVRLHIENNLREPALSVRTIADDTGVSARYLNKIFAHQPHTVAQLIRERRLEYCRRDLEDPYMAHVSATNIAFSWGFNSAAHFSRAYKERFGASPRAHRQRLAKKLS